MNAFSHSLTYPRDEAETVSDRYSGFICYLLQYYLNVLAQNKYPVNKKFFLRWRYTAGSLLFNLFQAGDNRDNNPDHIQNQEDRKPGDAGNDEYRPTE